MRRFVALPVLLMSLACPEPTLVSREVNGAFAPDGERVLVVESTYRTLDLDAPYYADETATDFELVLHAAQADDLEDREELVRFSDGARGIIEEGAVFWLPSKRRFVWYQGNEPFVPWLVDLDSGEQTELSLPEETWEALLAVATFPPGRHHAIPSPDEEHLGVLTATRTESGLVLVMSFFDADDGAHIASTTLDWPATNIDPWVVSPDGLQHAFLWAKDGSGVYVLDCEHAIFVPVAADGDVSEVTEVPGFAAPTRGGPVSDDGTRVTTREVGNASEVVLLPWGAWPVYGATPPTAWIAFDDIPLVPLDEVAYCQPR